MVVVKGTGEGAQAYGHGLYFAENRGVAEGDHSRGASRKPAGESAVRGRQFPAARVKEMAPARGGAGAILHQMPCAALATGRTYQVTPVTIVPPPGVDL